MAAIPPVLSICIPTYKRKASLERTLLALVEGVKGLSGEAEICVSDNASHDGTAQLLAEYVAKYPIIHVNTNETNVGFDGNIEAVLRMATGRYCWIIGDDDTIVPEGVAELVRNLEGEEEFVAGIVFAGPEQIIEDMSEALTERSYATADFVKLCSAYWLPRKRDDPLTCGFLPTYLYKRELALAALEHVGRNWYAWRHLALYYYILTNYDGRVVISPRAAVRHMMLGANLDKVLLPGEDLELHLVNRWKALTTLPLRPDLKMLLKAQTDRLAGVRYVQAILRLMYLSTVFSKQEYETMRRRVYSIGDGLEIHTWYSLAIKALKAMERIPLARQAVAFKYRTNSQYARLIEKSRAGLISTNLERDGKEKAQG